MALKTTAGILTGVAVHALAATIGLSAILASSATAFQTVRVAGGAYLLYLGARSLWLSRRDARPTEIAPNVSERPFLTGLMTNLLNPKVAILFLSLLPQFVSTSDSLLARTAQLASIFLVIGAVWLIFYSWVVARARQVLQKPRVTRFVERLSGAVLIGLGIRVLVGDR